MMWPASAVSEVIEDEVAEDVGLFEWGEVPSLRDDDKPRLGQLLRKQFGSSVEVRHVELPDADEGRKVQCRKG